MDIQHQTEDKYIFIILQKFQTHAVLGSSVGCFTLQLH